MENFGKKEHYGKREGFISVSFFPLFASSIQALDALLTTCLGTLFATRKAQIPGQYPNSDKKSRLWQCEHKISSSSQAGENAKQWKASQ